jgi:hypothetical protein
MSGWANISDGSTLSIMRLGALHAHDGKLGIGSNIAACLSCFEQSVGTFGNGEFRCFHVHCRRFLCVLGNWGSVLFSGGIRTMAPFGTRVAESVFIGKTPMVGHHRRSGQPDNDASRNIPKVEALRVVAPARVSVRCCVRFLMPISCRSKGRDEAQGLVRRFIGRGMAKNISSGSGRS